MIVVPNERLLSICVEGTSFRDALKRADEVLLHATQGISDLISVTGEVNVDFADVRTVMGNRGAALMGTGESSGENRAADAAQQAICSPLLEDVSINGATGVLVNITGGTDLAIDEVTTINSIVQEAAGDDVELIFGAVHDPALDEVLRVTVIATGFGEAPEELLFEPTDDVIPFRLNGPALVAAPEPAEMTTGLAADFGVPEFELGGVGAIGVDPILLAGDGLDDLEIPTFIRRQLD
jgi:cell division protein FtsZ